MAEVIIGVNPGLLSNGGQRRHFLLRYLCSFVAVIYELTGKGTFECFQREIFSFCEARFGREKVGMNLAGRRTTCSEQVVNDECEFGFLGYLE